MRTSFTATSLYRLRPPAVAGTLRRVGTKATLPVVRPHRRPHRFGKLPAPTPCPTAQPSTPDAHARQPRLLVGQRGTTNIATASAPVVAIGFGARAPGPDAGRLGWIRRWAKPAGYSLGSKLAQYCAPGFLIFRFRLNSKNSYKIPKYIENGLNLRKIHSKLL
jgi:hypothetical protein